MRTIDFSPLFRHSVGFDRMQRLMDAAAQTDQNNAYPPYNIEQLGENGYQVTLAVAGFSEDNIDITMTDRPLACRFRQAERQRSRTHFPASRDCRSRFRATLRAGGSYPCQRRQP